jgi:hypothetical protein
MTVNAALLLEVFEFPPFWFAIDAHAAWHLSTIPIPFLWFRYLLNFLQNQVDC